MKSKNTNNSARGQAKYLYRHVSKIAMNTWIYDQHNESLEHCTHKSQWNFLSTRINIIQEEIAGIGDSEEYT